MTTPAAGERATHDHPSVDQYDLSALPAHLFGMHAITLDPTLPDEALRGAHREAHERGWYAAYPSMLAEDDGMPSTPAVLSRLVRRPSPAAQLPLMTSEGSPRDELLADLRDRLEELDGDEPQEDRLSIGDWLARIQGAGTSAQQNARAGLPVEEERDWLELAAIALRRAETIRRLTS
jgi:hypothetical protein